MDEIYQQALKLLRRRDHTVAQLRRKLTERFDAAAAVEAVVDRLVAQRYLDDLRFAENVVARRGDRHFSRVMADLTEAGVPADIARTALAGPDGADWPSLQTVLQARMVAWNLCAPLSPRDAARLFRALGRLGYPEDAIREELEQLQ